MCRKKRGGSKCEERKHKDNEYIDAQTSESPGAYGMFQMTAGTTRPFHTTIMVNGSLLVMEVDTGASVSVISESTFHAIQNGVTTLELKETATQLHTYTAESIAITGSIEVQVEHCGQTRKLPLIVSAGDGPALLGRDWLSALRLDWKSIFAVGKNPTLQEVMGRQADVFKDGLGEQKGVAAKIHVYKDARPEFRKPNRVPFAIWEKVEKELDRLFSLGVIEPVKFSDWVAPIVPVLKGDGRVRICGDYKVTVNKAAKVDKCIPTPQDRRTICLTCGEKTFTKLDLSHAYLQVTLAPESQKYVTVNTHRGLFKYKCLPFRVASAPSIFQRVMESVLQGIAGVCVCLDDILVTGHTEQEHRHNLTQVLSHLEAAGMRLKKEKCAFMLPSVSYLGHVISAEGLHTSELKVKAVVDAPEPKNLAELRSFLGMVNYYRPDLATTLALLYLLLCQTTQWKWGREQEEAFKTVKDQLKSGQVLTHFDDLLPLVLACDASPYGVGAVLSHRMPDGVERPVGFASQTLTTAEKNYSHLDKEALAIVFGVKK